MKECHLTAVGRFICGKVHAIKCGMALLAAIVAFFSATAASAAVQLHDTYYSPKNKSRAVRKSTRFIILHTTEGPSRGSGYKLQQKGEAHYMVDNAGRVYRIIDRKRIAYHCGRSMWNGLSSLDNYSIGIEIVGYHNKDITEAQYSAVKQLVAELKKVYKLSDDKVLTHSMVAYGSPNQWHKRSHRGRKRCAMRMALPSVRRKLGLFSKPSYDPDVKAGRLVVADKELQQLLYSVERKSSKKAVVKSINKPAATKTAKPPTLSPSPVDEAEATAIYAAKESTTGGNVIGPRRSAWDIARDAYNSSTTIYVFPDGTRKTGAEIKNWKSMKAGTMVFVESGESNVPEKIASIASTGITTNDLAKTADLVLSSIAGHEWNNERTVYIQPDGSYFKGNELNAETLAKLSPETKVFIGYSIGGPITPKNPAFNICGPSWNDAGTHFLFKDGTIITGDKIDPRRIPSNTMILFKD